MLHVKVISFMMRLSVLYNRAFSSVGSASLCSNAPLSACLRSEECITDYTTLSDGGEGREDHRLTSERDEGICTDHTDRRRRRNVWIDSVVLLLVRDDQLECLDISELCFWHGE